MVPTIYGTLGSPSCRAVYLLCKAANFNFIHKNVFIFAGENKTPEYTKLNPQQTIPTLLEGDGFTIWDSHAIMIYISEKYLKDASFYPKDYRNRAVINQRLHFDSGILFPRLANLIKSALSEGKRGITSEKIGLLKEGYNFANKFLTNNKYMASNELSIADFSIVSTLSSALFFAPIDSKEFSELFSWLKRMESLPYYKQANQDGVDALSNYLTKKLEKNKL